MYKLEFGNYEKRNLYLFKLVDGVFPSTTLDWVEVIGDAFAVNLRYDPVDKDGIFTTIIKTSLEVSLVRTNEVDFIDIIESEENEYFAVIIEDGEVRRTESGADEGKPYLYSTGDIKLIFYGAITNESYGETFNHFANIKITFNDRIGILTDEKVSISNSHVNLLDIFYNCFENVIPRNNILFEFPYNINVSTYKNLKTPADIILDIRDYVGKTKKELLSNILEAYGLRLHADFTILNPSSNLLEKSGGLIIYTVENFVEQVNSFFSFELDGTEYSEITPISQMKSLKVLADEYHIKDRSGSWVLARRAKSIEAITDLQLLENMIFPATFGEDDYEADSEGVLYSKYWRLPLSTFASITEAISNIDFTNMAILGHSGNQQKLGLRSVGLSQGIYISKSSKTLNFDFSIYCAGNYTALNLLIANYKGSYYYFDNNDLLWHLTTTGFPITLGFKVDLTEKGYTTQQYTDIPQPTQIPEGEHYGINVLKGAQLTSTGNVEYDFKLSLNIDGNVLKKIKLTTIIAETRRKSKELKPKFYNLPGIGSSEAIYKNGIFATNLDKYNGNGLVEASCNDIVAPANFVYDGNNATLMVHLSEMVGKQHLYDRWIFNCNFIRGTFREQVIAAWINPICEGEGDYTYSGIWVDAICEMEEPTS